MGKLLWKPSEERITGSNMYRFMTFVNGRHQQNFTDYDGLYAWSVSNIADFWADVWDFVGIKASRRYDEVIDDDRKMPGAKWFSGARLNFAENLLRFRDDSVALIFKGEDHPTRKMTYAELYDEVARIGEESAGGWVGPGDRVAGFMPNMPETVIAMLAATSIGAVWSSCSPDFGIKGVLDRFGQIKPKVLFVADGYFFKGKNLDSLSRVAEILKALPSIEKVVVVPYTEQEPDISALRNAFHYQAFGAQESGLEDRLRATRLRPPALHHVHLGDDRSSQVHGPERRGNPDPSSQGTDPPYEPDAGGHDLLFHHLRVDDVELAGQLARRRGEARPLMTAIPSIPIPVLCGGPPRMRRSRSSGPVPVTSPH